MRNKIIIFCICSLILCIGFGCIFFIRDRKKPKEEDYATIEIQDVSDADESTSQINIEDESEYIYPERTELEAELDKYYGDVFYTDQTDLEEPTVTVSNIEEIYMGLYGNEYELTPDMTNRLYSRLTSFANTNHIQADKVTVQKWKIKKANNAGYMRTEYGIVYNDDKGTKAILVIYPDDPFYQMYMDIIPADGSEEYFQESVLDNSDDTPELNAPSTSLDS